MTALSPRNPNHSGSRRTQPINTHHSTRSSVLTLILLWLCLTLPATAMAQNTVLVFGDSLSAAYGIAEENGWVTLLEENSRKPTPMAGPQRQRQRRNHRRRPTPHQQSPRASHPGNRHPPTRRQRRPKRQRPSTMRKTLATMIERSKKTGAKVPDRHRNPPNYGQQYTTAFRNQYRGNWPTPTPSTSCPSCWMTSTTGTA